MGVKNHNPTPKFGVPLLSDNKSKTTFGVLLLCNTK
jgi:hypothetical protein